MNTETEQIDVAVKAVAERPRPDVAKFVSEIDEYLGQTFDAMSVIDESYGKISSFFIEMADQRFGDTDFDKLSKNEQKEASLYMAAAIAVQGVCAVTKGIKETIALENVKRLHRQVAEQRHGSLPRQIERARRCHDDAAMTLLQHNGHPFRSSEIKKTFQATANLLETELCQYRDLRFRLDMLLWLQDEYEAWLEGRLYSDTPMPTMGQATIAAIYLVAGKRVHACRINTPEAIPEMIQAAQPPVSKDNLRAELSKFGDELVAGLDFSKFPNGKDFISAFEILAVIDTQMAAVLEYYSLDADPLAEARAEAGPDAEDSELDVDKVTCYRLYGNICYNSTSEEYPQIHAALENNPVACKSLACFEAFFDMLDKCKRGLTMGTINGLLIAAAVILPFWTFKWSWYWALGVSVVLFFIVRGIFIGPSLRGITSNFMTKFQMMNCYYKHHLMRDAGLVEPRSRIKEMAKSRNHIWIGIIVGGLIGMIFTPLGAIIGAIIGALIGSGSSGDYDDHGEGWEEVKICSPVKQWLTLIVVGAVVILEAFGLYFILTA